MPINAIMDTPLCKRSLVTCADKILTREVIAKRGAKPDNN
jgi:hypothetical protein